MLGKSCLPSIGHLFDLFEICFPCEYILILKDEAKNRLRWKTKHQGRHILILQQTLKSIIPFIACQITSKK
jgi:hypothetical protein